MQSNNLCHARPSYVGSPLRCVGIPGYTVRASATLLFSKFSRLHMGIGYMLYASIMRVARSVQCLDKVLFIARKNEPQTRRSYFSIEKRERRAALHQLHFILQTIPYTYTYVVYTCSILTVICTAAGSYHTIRSI